MIVVISKWYNLNYTFAIMSSASCGASPDTRNVVNIAKASIKRIDHLHDSGLHLLFVYIGTISASASAFRSSSSRPCN